MAITVDTLLGDLSRMLDAGMPQDTEVKIALKVDNETFRSIEVTATGLEYNPASTDPAYFALEGNLDGHTG